MDILGGAPECGEVTMAVLWHPEQRDAACRALREMTAGHCLNAELCFSHLLLVNLILGFSLQRENPTQQ